MHFKNLLEIKKKVNALACFELMTCRSIARVNLLRYGVKHQNRERKNILLLILKKNTKYGGVHTSVSEIADMGKYSVDDQC